MLLFAVVIENFCSTNKTSSVLAEFLSLKWLCSLYIFVIPPLSKALITSHLAKLFSLFIFGIIFCRLSLCCCHCRFLQFQHFRKLLISSNQTKLHSKNNPTISKTARFEQPDEVSSLKDKVFLFYFLQFVFLLHTEVTAGLTKTVFSQVVKFLAFNNVFCFYCIKKNMLEFGAIGEDFCNADTFETLSLFWTAKLLCLSLAALYYAARFFLTAAFSISIVKRVLPIHTTKIRHMQTSAIPTFLKTFHPSPRLCLHLFFLEWYRLPSRCM